MEHSRRLLALSLLGLRRSLLVKVAPVRNRLCLFLAVNFEWDLVVIAEDDAQGRRPLVGPWPDQQLVNRLRVDVVVLGEFHRDHGWGSSSVFSRFSPSPAHHHFGSPTPSRSVHPQHGFHVVPPPAADPVYHRPQSFFTFPTTKYWVYR